MNLEHFMQGELKDDLETIDLSEVGIVYQDTHELDQIITNQIIRKPNNIIYADIVRINAINIYEYTNNIVFAFPQNDIENNDTVCSSHNIIYINDNDNQDECLPHCKITVMIISLCAISVVLISEIALNI
jgi:hypothetical protein